MPKGRRKSKGIEVSGIYGKKKPSEIYEDQDWTYYCSDCRAEVMFYQSTCPNCGKQFDWTKSMLVSSEDYDPERERAYREMLKKSSRRRRR